MTLLTALIDGASGDTAVTTLLRKVKVVASRAEVPALDDWVDHELDGYPPGVELPEYRGPFEAEVLGIFSGPFGSGLQNAPIPSVGFPKDYRDGPLFNITYTQSIAQIQELAAGEGSLQAPWPANAIALTNSLMAQGKVSLYNDMGLQQAWRVVSRSQIVAIVDTVRTRILDLALTMERDNPQAGESGGPALTPEAKQTIVTNIFGGTPNVAVASSDFSQSVAIAKGDADSLSSQLSAIGLPREEIEALWGAIEADGGLQVAEVGENTSSWLTRLMIRSQELGLGTAGGVIANLICQYLGIA